MARLLLVGSSHAVRVRAALEREVHSRNPSTQVLVLGRGGLRADQTVCFIDTYATQISLFQPSHIIIHVGHCDLFPKDVKEMGRPLCGVMKDLTLIKGRLLDITPDAKIAVSEMFPRVLARKPTTKDLDMKVRAYNRKIAQAAKLNYNLVAPVITHPRFRISHRAADPQYFLSDEGRYYGLHLNDAGNRCFAEDLVNYVI